MNTLYNQFEILEDPRFKSEKQYVKMSIQEIKKRLIILVVS